MRRSGVRIPLAPPQADIRSGCRFFVCLGVVAAGALLCYFGAAGVPGAVGPGRCVCRWAAARPRDRHTRAFGSEWSISRPALALPPPTGTAARLSGALHTGGACVAWTSPARPCHRPQAPQPGPPDPPAPSTLAAPGVLMVFEARPGPTAAHRRCGLAPPPPIDTGPGFPPGL